MSQRVLIVIPTFNESENIGNLMQRIHDLHPEIAIRVVDDSPNTETIDAVDAKIAEIGAQHITGHHRKEKGRGGAVLAGFAWGKAQGYDLFFEMDADFSHRPEEIQDFLDAIENVDVVIGSRYLPKSEIHNWGRKRTIFSWLANLYAKVILRIPISDYTNGFRCYSRKAVESLNTESIDAQGYIVLSEISYQLYKNGCTFTDVPTIFINRERGESNLSRFEIQEAFLSILRIRSPELYQHAEQSIFFIISGLLGAILDIGSLAVWVEVIGTSKLTGFILSTATAMLLVFLFNRHITFKSNEHEVHKQGLRFLLVYTFTAVLNVGFSEFMLYLGFYYLVAKSIAIGIIAVINYLFSHFFIFKMDERSA